DPLDGARPRFAEERRLAALGWGSLATFPLAFEGRLLGALQIASQPGEALPPCCVAVVRRVADLVAIAFQNSLMVGEIRRLNQLLGSENALLREELRHARKDDRYVAESPSMKAVLEQVRRVASSDSTVLIRGETGTGKEGLARRVHDLSARRDRPFVAVNLGALPEGLVESELFGHEKGAFTGALRQRPGRFEQADGGTIFLDEVGDAPPSVQVRLLRVLQERELDRVGGTVPVKVDVRVVAATNRDLEASVASGTFREDLYYRLAVVPISLPPLRQRPEDVRPLVEHFLARHAALMGRPPPEVPEPLWATLRGHAWPGNVRELENLVQRALILSPGPVLELPGPLGEPERQPPAGAASPEVEERALGTFEEEVRAVIERALDGASGRVYGPHGAAARLGLKPSTLQGKMKRYGVPEGRGRRR
ncbi:MAG TPA: sigma 54-interacting transcriptional regulator, partial [Anaeromyxobacteraceae bacterium]|nr:sigma 54-interacting transcriptional regulator [Anaeromyxobacteraceae bacterium]